MPSLLYGIVSYALFLATFLYLIAFVGDFYVPKILSSAATTPPFVALLINLGLITLFGLQHSIMARSGFKSAIEKIIPTHLERSTYVAISSLVLILLMWAWQPIDGVVWYIQSSIGQILMWVLFSLGWALVFIATFLTDHFDLFGLRQVWLNFVKRTYTHVPFTDVLFYRWIRHPMMLGIILAIWCLPSMTVGHAVFSVGMTVYILIGIYFEERSLARALGQDYVTYQQRTKKILPKLY